MGVEVCGVRCGGEQPAAYVRGEQVRVFGAAADHSCGVGGAQPLDCGAGGAACGGLGVDPGAGVDAADSVYE